MRVLVIDDEARLAENISEALRESAGFAVDRAEDGETGITLAANQCYDLIILDLMLPRIDGANVLRRLRSSGDQTPILILTAKDEVKSKIELLNAGADDYLSKPFDLYELLARAKALIRRGKGVAHPTLKSGQLIVNTLEQTVTRAGESIVPLAHGVPRTRILHASTTRRRLQARTPRASLRLQLGASLQRHRSTYLQPAQKDRWRRRHIAHRNPAWPRLPHARSSPGNTMTRYAMTPYSITRRLVIIVLLVELISALCVTAVAFAYERHMHFRSFDILLRGRADTVLGAVQDAEDPADNVMMDGTETRLPADDIYEVQDASGRVVGKSNNWAGPEILTSEKRAHGHSFDSEHAHSEHSRDEDQSFAEASISGSSYRVVHIDGLRIVDPGDKGGGVRRYVSIYYGSPVRRIWQAIMRAVAFYATSSLLVMAFPPAS